MVFQDRRRRRERTAGALLFALFIVYYDGIVLGWQEKELIRYGWIGFDSVEWACLLCSRVVVTSQKTQKDWRGARIFVSFGYLVWLE